MKLKAMLQRIRWFGTRGKNGNRKNIQTVTDGANIRKNEKRKTVGNIFACCCKRLNNCNRQEEVDKSKGG